MTQDNEGLQIYEEAYQLALNGVSTEDLLRSESLFLSALSFFEKTKSVKDISRTYNELGALKYRSADYDAAIEYLHKSLDLTKTTGDERQAAMATTNLAAIYLDKHDYKKALGLYKKSLNYCKKNEDMYLASIALAGMATIYKNLRDFTRSIHYLKICIDIAEILKNTRKEGLALASLCETCRIAERIGPAREYGEKAKAIGETLDDSEILTQTYNSLGLVQFNLGEYSQAIEYQDKALQHCKRFGNLIQQSVVLSNLGYSYVELHDYDTAIEYFHSSFELSIKLGDIKQQVITLSDIGMMCLYLQKKPNALEYFEKAHELSRQTGQRKHTVKLSGMISDIRKSLRMN